MGKKRTHTNDLFQNENYPPSSDLQYTGHGFTQPLLPSLEPEKREKDGSHER